MILAAGRGERLRPLTERIPKPLIPIGSEPLIVHQLRWLHRAGIRDVVVNLHHLGGEIERALGSGSDLGVRIRYSVEERLLDTGGGIKNALPILGDEPFVLLNGDIWTSYRFVNLIGVRPRRAHLVLTPTPPEKARADFHLAEGHVRRGVANDLTYCGIAVIDKALFADSPDGPFSLAEPLFEAAANGDLEGELFDGVWIDIGTPDQLKRVRRLTL